MFVYHFPLLKTTIRIMAVLTACCLRLLVLLLKLPILHYHETRGKGSVRQRSSFCCAYCIDPWQHHPSVLKKKTNQKDKYANI